MNTTTDTRIRTTKFSTAPGAGKREPETDHFCCVCRKDLKPGQAYRLVHIIGGGALALHPDSEAQYIDDDGDMGCFPIGSDCARRLGLEFSAACPPA